MAVDVNDLGACDHDHGPVAVALRLTSRGFQRARDDSTAAVRAQSGMLLAAHQYARISFLSQTEHVASGAGCQEYRDTVFS